MYDGNLTTWLVCAITTERTWTERENGSVNTLDTRHTSVSVLGPLASITQPNCILYILLKRPIQHWKLSMCHNNEGSSLSIFPTTEAMERYCASLLVRESSEVPGRLLHTSFGSQRPLTTMLSQSTSSYSATLLYEHVRALRLLSCRYNFVKPFTRSCPGRLLNIIKSH